MLGRLQQGLEHLYRIETELEVRDFLLGDDARKSMGLARAPREQLLLAEEAGELSVGLCFADDVLKTLEQGEPHEHIDANLEPFLLAIEGVSHFVCVAWNARRERKISALELEMQAEVDKYMTCLLTLAVTGDTSGAERLRQRLFVEVEFDAELSREEYERYWLANQTAYRYSGSLESRYVKNGRIAEMLPELRRFYRLPLADKLEWMAR